MDADEIYIHSQALLLKIHVVTGWVIPAKDLMIVLLDQFNKKIKESYDVVNPDEIEYAFRTHGTTVKDWGKQMNLALIDEVMIPYLQQRSEISRLEEQIKSKPKMIEEKRDLTDADYQSWYDQVAKDVLDNNLSLLLIPEPLFHWLKKTKQLELEMSEYHGYMDKAIEFQHHQLAERVTSNLADAQARRELKEFEERRKTGFSGSHLLNLQTLARKVAVYDYIRTSSL